MRVHNKGFVKLDKQMSTLKIIDLSDHILPPSEISLLEKMV